MINDTIDGVLATGSQSRNLWNVKSKGENVGISKYFCFYEFVGSFFGQSVMKSHVNFATFTFPSFCSTRSLIYYLTKYQLTSFSI